MPRWSGAASCSTRPFGSTRSRRPRSGAEGNSLGELGSRIVAETIVGLLVNDRHSYLNARGGWDPSKGVRLPNGDQIRSIRDFLSFTGVPA